jgi:hypothetical protein
MELARGGPLLNLWIPVIWMQGTAWHCLADRRLCFSTSLLFTLRTSVEGFTLSPLGEGGSCRPAQSRNLSSLLPVLGAQHSEPESSDTRFLHQSQKQKRSRLRAASFTPTVF